MAALGKNKSDKKIQDELQRLKKDVENSREYDADNYRRYNQSRVSIFKSSLTEDEISALGYLKKPVIECNIGEAYVSRLRGEFSKQEPSISVSSCDDEPIDPKKIETVDGNLRHALFEANNNGFEYNTYSEQLTGGFSVWEIGTRYKTPMSFSQEIYFSQTYDPTLTGFDPLARLKTKSDGRYCYKLYPVTKSDFVKRYKGIDISSIGFNGSMAGFTWSYRSMREEIILVCEFYEKKYKDDVIVFLPNNRSMLLSKYEKMIEQWDRIEQPPVKIAERETTFTTIDRYTFIENQILDYVETNDSDLPLIWVDGNSQVIKEASGSQTKLLVRPYTYHLEGCQKLLNFALQSLGAELQNMVAHKWKVAKESIPKQYLKAYTNNQVPNVVIYNHLKDNDPNIVLPPPMEVTRTPIPPEISNTIPLMQQMSQNILGSFDASLGINNNQLSGTAIVEGATQSNSAAMPYIVGFIQAMNQLAQIYVNKLPEVLKNNSKIPVLKRDGKKDVVNINSDNGILLDYLPNSLNVKVEAGVNFTVQKSRAVEQMIGLSQAMPLFAQFLNDKCIPQLLDNLDFQGVDQMKVLYEGWQKENEIKQQQQQQLAMQNNPMLLKKQELNLRATKQQDEKIAEAAKIGISQQQADTEQLRVMMEAKAAHDENLEKVQRLNTESFHAATELAIEAAKHHHGVNKDMLELNHKISSENSFPP